ncbi:hypothetical protein DPX16_21267 [Anabarilius grahami]|uniref:Uncharacterized protein n=1 Tax=Anabarilius grahami TaxID=495550 RepID=A0A3N0XQF1_ANAGA|nr:hypothetical protein DPX16_21267 [Anabarilius grahami]
MSSHSLPSLSPHERPRRQAQLPARYDDFILQYHPQSLSTAETPEQQPPYPAHMSGTGPHYQPRRERESEEELEEPELPTEGDTQEDIPHPHSTIPSERVPTSEAEHPLAPPIARTIDTQSVLLQQLIEEIRNQGRLIQQCMHGSRSSTHSSQSRSASPRPDSLNLQPIVSSQARQTTNDHRLPTFLPQQQLPSPPPVSRAPLTQPVPQSMQLTHPPGCGQFPATSQAPAMFNSMYPAYTLPSQPLPGVMSYSAQPAYSVQPHHLISAAPLSQLVPPVGPQQSTHRRIEGYSFPDLTREDESQYLMLKMALSNLDVSDIRHCQIREELSAELCGVSDVPPRAPQCLPESLACVVDDDGGEEEEGSSSFERLRSADTATKGRRPCVLC